MPARETIFDDDQHARPRLAGRVGSRLGTNRRVQSSPRDRSAVMSMAVAHTGPAREALSCECYSVVKTETDRLLGRQREADHTTGAFLP